MPERRHDHGQLDPRLVAVPAPSIAGAAMRQSFIALIIILALQTAVQPATAIDGNRLHEDCAAPDELYARGSALGYILGVYEHAALHPQSEVKFCTPSGATQGKVRDTVCEWLVNHPDKRDRQAADLVVEALNEAWPCKP